MTGDEGSAPDGDPGIAGRAAPLPFDTSEAHQARIYNYVLGGKDNYAADRAAAEAWMKVYPQLTFDMRANRAFLGRVVRYLAGEAGIRQFLDIGTGIPAAGNTHEIAQEVAPESRIVYVDYDPVVLAHARALLISHPAGATAYIDADLRDTGTILDRARQVLDFTKPVAVTLLAILHAVPEADDPYTVVQTLLDAVPPGSYLALSHLAADRLTGETKGALSDVAERMVRQQITYRSREQIARFFEGTDLVAPGIVAAEEWRPVPGAAAPGHSSVWCAVGRKTPRN
jgi:SAM-dependent methyltransferase